MAIFAELLTIFGQRQRIRVGIDAGLIQLVQRNEAVADFVGGIAQHQNDFFCAQRHAAQADGKAVAREDGEDHAHRFAAQLGTNVGSHILHACVIALASCHDGFGHGDDVAVAQGEALALRCVQHGAGHDGGQIIALTDDGAADAAGDRSNFSFHNSSFLSSVQRACAIFLAT